MENYKSKIKNKQYLVDKWKHTGLLGDLKIDQIESMARLLELQAQQLLEHHYSNCQFESKIPRKLSTQ